MKYPKTPVIFLAAAMTIPTLAIANDDDELELDEAQLYFELNDTDGDLGIHGKADGDAWKRMKIEAPNERKLLDIRVRSKLRRQGLTELFFESSEPTFDELNPTTFFNRFPEGVYEWEGRTLDHEEIEGEMYLSHIIPAAPVVASIGGVDQEDNPGFEEDDEGELEKVCWEDVETLDDGSVVIVWEEVMESHFDKWSNPENEPLLNEVKIPLGKSGDIGEIAYYEFVAEIDDTEFKTTAAVPSDTTSWTIPGTFIALAEPDEGEREIKFEIIVRVESGAGEDDDGEEVDSTLGNQAAVEDCFVI
jgi:hypothetical protein